MSAFYVQFDSGRRFFPTVERAEAFARGRVMAGVSAPRTVAIYRTDDIQVAAIDKDAYGRVWTDVAQTVLL